MEFVDIFSYKLPIAHLIDQLTNWLTTNCAGFFNLITKGGSALMDFITNGLLFLPPLLLIVLLTIAAYFGSNRHFKLPALTLLGLLFVYNQGLWTGLMNTFTLVLIASLVSVIIGIPLGIWMAKNDKVQAVVKPILDFMQTMPAFVYLIPAVAFFGIGMVPGVFASVIFALPPTVRFTNLAIRQIPKELVEATDAFGSTPKQKLFSLELPMAKPTIWAGINQTIMLALSMVVTASMIGAPGLGKDVLSALQHANIGTGFVAGLALVILAIIIDRFTQKFNQPIQAKPKLTPKQKRNHRLIVGGILAAIILVLGAGNFKSLTQKAKPTVNLGYVDWDSEVASTNVIAQVLRDQGFKVELTSLDNAVLWKSVADGSVDAEVGAWLPTTHGNLYKQYHNNLVDLGPNLKGVKLGLAVPAYMNVNSISDLSNQANKTITGIEPGAGVTAAAKKTLKAYSNLNDWQLSTSSSGAMTVALDKAIKQHQEIVITGWSPHWMFAKYKLKYLADSKHTMGRSENIHTIVKKNLKTDNPKAYRILKKFTWTKEDMESVMLDINNGMSPQKAAQKWIKAHPKQVKAWVD